MGGRRARRAVSGVRCAGHSFSVSMRGAGRQACYLATQTRLAVNIHCYPPLRARALDATKRVPPPEIAAARYRGTPVVRITNPLQLCATQDNGWANPIRPFTLWKPVIMICK